MMPTARDPEYLDESAVRSELVRVHDVCGGCRRCTELCTSFPTLFDLLDRRGDAGSLTPAEQDRVTDACVQCKLCVIGCPHDVDVPRTMLRASAMQYASDITTIPTRFTTRLFGRTRLIGAIGARLSTAVDRLLGRPPRSLPRRMLSALTGVTARRSVLRFADQRFSTWCSMRPGIRLRDKQAEVSVVPTCLVEYHRPDIGKDLIRVYERNGIQCSISDVACCGAPSLHGGDVARFTDVATANARRLAREIRAGRDVVVAQPSCAHVLRHATVDHVRADAVADAELVAAHTWDASEYLLAVHMGEDAVLDTDFDGDVPTSITYHAPSTLRAQQPGFKSRDLLMLTGAEVTTIQQGAGTESLWDLRAEMDDAVEPIARELGETVLAQRTGVVSTDCVFAAEVIAEHTGRIALHPLQIVARAYGIGDRY